MKDIKMKEFAKKLAEMMEENAPRVLSRIDKNKLMAALASRGVTAPQPILCTNEPQRTEEFDKLSNKERDEYDKLFYTVRNPSASRQMLTAALRKAHDFREKYPKIPSVYNFIYGLSIRLDKDEEAFAVLQDTLERFPDYLFSKLSLAEHYMRQGEHHKIPDVLNHKFELHQHFPKGTKTFHVSEVIAFHGMLCSYYAYTGDLAQALLHYSIIANIYPEHPRTKELAKRIILADMDKKIPHKNLLDEFLLPESEDDAWDDDVIDDAMEDTIDDPIETAYLVEQLQAHLPITVTPTKHLVHTEVGKEKKLKINDRLKVTTIHYMGDEGGIICGILRGKEVLAISLSHLLLDKKHPLYKYARHYQLRRIKTLASQQQYRAPF